MRCKGTMFFRNHKLFPHFFRLPSENRNLPYTLVFFLLTLLLSQVFHARPNFGTRDAIAYVLAIRTIRLTNLNHDVSHLSLLPTLSCSIKYETRQEMRWNTNKRKRHITYNQHFISFPFHLQHATTSVGKEYILLVFKASANRQHSNECLHSHLVMHRHYGQSKSSLPILLYSSNPLSNEFSNG